MLEDEPAVGRGMGRDDALVRPEDAVRRRVLGEEPLGELLVGERFGRWGGGFGGLCGLGRLDGFDGLDRLNERGTFDGCSGRCRRFHRRRYSGTGSRSGGGGSGGGRGRGSSNGGRGDFLDTLRLVVVGGGRGAERSGGFGGGGDGGGAVGVSGRDSLTPRAELGLDLGPLTSASSLLIGHC